MPEKQNSSSTIRLPLVLCLGLAIGLFIGYRIQSNSLSAKAESDFQKLREVVDHIDKEYVDDVPPEKLVNGAIDEMLSKLDPHSAYIPKEEKLLADEDLRGNFDGIGIEFNIFNDTIVVVTPLSGGPSEAAGIHSGDKIVKVDSFNVAGNGVTNRRVMELLKGPSGTEVTVGILRGDNSELLDFTLRRDKIPQNSVDVAYMVNKNTGYIKVSRFSASTSSEFSSALKRLKATGMEKLVLDLQGNPGGYMNMAIEMADEFLPEKKRIVFSKGKNKKFDSDAWSTEAGSFETGDLIVLVNEGSASASEIVTGALQDNDRALIVGRRSFGKGLVQAQFDLTDGSELRLTISRYYTPSGRSIQKPYNDEEAYARDLISRYNKGEFFHADSVKFNDSLKYQTTSGRTVYGGGGIMPDYFVPLDTTLNSHFLNELYSSTSLQEYTFSYADSHKKELSEAGFEAFQKNFKVTDGMLDALMVIGRRNGVKIDKDELREKKNLFRIHVKAQIARNLWGNGGYYPIINETNEVFVQALKLFDRIPMLNHSKM